MKKATGFKVFIEDQLADLQELHIRSMFGGFGLYRGDVFFGIIADSSLFFKTDDSSRAEYEVQGMGPFKPTPRQTLKTYYEVPGSVVEDSGELIEWALRAIEAAERSK